MTSDNTVAQNEMLECSYETSTAYADPFNEIEVDVVFAGQGRTWRVPAFWRGGNRWSVRFAAPLAGEYTCHLVCTDKQNLDLNGHSGTLTVTPYQGTNALLRHGPLRVSANGRYLEHADGAPFCWLGDTWWTAMSTRLSWEDYRTLAADRKAKGFNLVQLVAGLVPFDELPFDPGFCNEGGAVWEEGFARINPAYFDSMDRRIQHLVDLEMVPAIVAAWNKRMVEMGGERLKQHWRYIIARFGAYPVVWILGGEVWDPPADVAHMLGWPSQGPWTDVARYVRRIDPYRHPFTVHEAGPSPYVLQDESLTDFDMFQSGHAPGMEGITAAAAQMMTHYARRCVTKPLVQGEIGYEGIFGGHGPDFQRFAYWVSMLNGGCGHTYGADGVFETYSSTAPLSRQVFSLTTWQEGMLYAGSYQVGIAKKLLEGYPWWRFQPHPEWIVPRSTTLLEPHDAYCGHDNLRHFKWFQPNGEFDLSYAAGISGEVRFIYIPFRRIDDQAPPTVLGLEEGVSYHACYWEPALGVKIDLGTVRRVLPGATILEHALSDKSGLVDYLGESVCRAGRLVGTRPMLTLCEDLQERDVVVSVQVRADADAMLILRFGDVDNYLAGVYSPTKKTICISDRRQGQDGAPLGAVSVPALGSSARLSAEVRGGWMALQITDGRASYSTPIVSVKNVAAGRLGVAHLSDGELQAFANLTVRRCGELPVDAGRETKLYDASGRYRGEFFSDVACEKVLLLEAYRAPNRPTAQDYLLVLERI